MCELSPSIEVFFGLRKNHQFKLSVVRASEVGQFIQILYYMDI